MIKLHTFTEDERKAIKQASIENEAAFRASINKSREDALQRMMKLQQEMTISKAPKELDKLFLQEETQEGKAEQEDDPAVKLARMGRSPTSRRKAVGKPKEALAFYDTKAIRHHCANFNATKDISYLAEIFLLTKFPRPNDIEFKKILRIEYNEEEGKLDIIFNDDSESTTEPGQAVSSYGSRYGIQQPRPEKSRSPYPSFKKPSREANVSDNSSLPSGGFISTSKEGLGHKTFEGELPGIWDQLEAIDKPFEQAHVNPTITVINPGTPGTLDPTGTEHLFWISPEDNPTQF